VEGVAPVPRGEPRHRRERRQHGAQWPGACGTVANPTEDRPRCGGPTGVAVDNWWEFMKKIYENKATDYSWG